MNNDEKNNINVEIVLNSVDKLLVKKPNRETISILFEHIRNHEWIEFKNILEHEKSVDVNIRDNQANYLLTYAVRFNRLDIVSMILNRGGKYDIVDRLERSILYDAIESNYLSVIETLLKHSEKSIGVMITDIRDLNGNIPLHYAIKFKNEDIVNLLIQYKSNPYTTDVDGYNSLHLAVRSGSIKIVSAIIDVMTTIDTKTNKGETALHIAINYQFNTIAALLLNENADPNIVDNSDEFSPLHYAVGWNSLDIIELLADKGADPNVQDIYGSTPLMYCIKEDYESAFNKIITKYEDISNRNPKLKIKYNLWNLDGKILLHDILEHYNETKLHYVNKIIKYSNLSIQDNNGNTCMHYLIVLDLWKNYIDILETKKINIFAKNSAGKAVIDLIYTDDKYDVPKMIEYNEFIDTITKSYIYMLKKQKKDWNTELDKICGRDMSELTNDEKKFITDNISNENDIDTGCYLLIRNKLIGDIKKYREGKLSYCQRSYPTTLINCVEVTEGVILDVCTFTGSLLDVLFGLIFLIKKHGNIVCTTLGKQHTPRDELCNFYKSMGLIMNGRCEFLNFEIVWIDYKLYLIDDFSELFSSCVQSSARFIIIPLGIEMKSGSHANYLIYDKELKELERFEPHGGTTPIGFNYNTHFLDDILTEYFKSIDKDIKYIKPNDFIPKIGFQLMDSQEENKRRIGDPGGFCALWSIWYVDQRLTYYMYDRKSLIKELFKNIKAQSVSYRNMIRNYSKNIIKQRDDLLTSADMDINDWLNDNYTYTQLDKFIGILMNEINTCCTTKKYQSKSVNQKLSDPVL